MKKLLLLVAALSLVACTSNKPTKDTTTPAPAQTVAEQTTTPETAVTEQDTTSDETTVSSEEAPVTEDDSVVVEATTVTEEATTEEVVAPTEDQTYTITKGDNLFRIGLKYNMSWETLANVNNIEDANVITEGTILTIPTTK